MTNYSKFFKAYDIRGTYPEINANLYYWVGKGIAETVLKPEGLPLKFVLAKDGRYTSPDL